MDVLHKPSYDRLFTSDSLYKCYAGSDPINRNKPFVTAISALIETTGNLANLVINVFEVQANNNEKMVNVIEIPVCKEGLYFVQVYEYVQDTIKKYPNATWLLGGSGFLLNRIRDLLSCENSPFENINWGGQCFTTEDRQHYTNKRSMAYAGLRRAVVNQRIKISTDSPHKGRVMNELGRVGYQFDLYGRIKVLSTEISGKVRLGDTCAFPFLKTIVDPAPALLRRPEALI